MFQEGVLTAIGDSLDYMKQTTCIACGLRTATDDIFKPEYGDRPDVPNVAILFTDGKANTDAESTMSEAARLRTEGTRFYNNSVNNNNINNIN